MKTAAKTDSLAPAAPRGDTGDWVRELFGRPRSSRRSRKDYSGAKNGSSDPKRRRRVPYVNAAGETEFDPHIGVFD